MHATTDIHQYDLFKSLRPADSTYLVVAALASELPMLGTEKVLFTGVGKVNAAYALTRYLALHPEVKTVINYGTAGGAAAVKKGELVRCTTFVQGDMNCGELSPPGITFNDPVMLQGRIDFGDGGLVCRTQDQFITNVHSLDMLEHLFTGGERFNVVDMEAYALAKVCAQMGKDFHCYKYISDDANETADNDWETNVHRGEPLFYETLINNHGYDHIQ
jgi:adenosylhomocysteine nucleosidase